MNGKLDVTLTQDFQNAYYLNDLIAIILGTLKWVEYLVNKEINFTFLKKSEWSCNVINESIKLWREVQTLFQKSLNPVCNDFDVISKSY